MIDEDNKASAKLPDIPLMLVIGVHVNVMSIAVSIWIPILPT